VTGLGFTNLLVVAAIAFAAPLVLGLAPGVRLPAVVLELAAGIAVGPHGLGWVEPDDAVRVVALLGLAFLLFLAGLEIEIRNLRGQRLRLALAGFAVTVALGLGLGAVVGLLAGIALTATSLGVVVPVLKDAGQVATDYGQQVIAASSIADFGAIVLLTLFFSREGAGTGGQLVLLASFAVLAAGIGLIVSRAGRSMRLGGALVRLQDTTAQIRVRGAFVLLVGFAALAESLGLEVILGAFAAGALLGLLDRDETMSHPLLRVKLEGAGYGIFIPVFFVWSGLQFDVGALGSGGATLARIPLFFLALLAVRGLPALLYRLDARRTVAAALLQATSLPFIVAAAQIGMELGKLSRTNGAALVAAGLLSVLLFPLAALALLGAPGAERGEERVPRLGLD
jgi:Kef-type K+ transport system membrane component KefB